MTQATPSPTPILDRTLPPPAAKSTRTRNAVAAAVGLLIGILAGVFDVKLPSLLLFVLFWELTIAVHEGAHVLAGSLAGFACHGVAIFGCYVKRAHPGWRLTFQIRNLSCGAAYMLPSRLDLPDWRYGTIIAAGPVANTLLLATVWWMHLPEWAESARWPAMLALGTLTLSSLLPFTTEGAVSDVARLIARVRGGEAWERWKLVLSFLALNAQGVPPREWDKDALHRAASFCGGRATDRLQATLLAYGAAIDRGEFSEAVLLLETALALSGRVGRVLRSSVFLEAALFQAQRRNDAVTARAWLTQASPARGVSRGCIAAVEAAVLLAEGRPAEATPPVSPVTTHAPPLTH